MRLPFALVLPSNLQAFSAEFMSAFDAEPDDGSLESAQAVAAPTARAAEKNEAAPPADQPKSIITSAADTAAFIASSFRSLTATSGSSHQPNTLPQATTRAQTEVDLEHCVGNSDLQLAVDEELAAFRRFNPTATLFAFSGLAFNMLRIHYMRFSFAMLVIGIIVLIFV